MHCQSYLFFRKDMKNLGFQLFDIFNFFTIDLDIILIIIKAIQQSFTHCYDNTRILIQINIQSHES